MKWIIFATILLFCTPVVSGFTVSSVTVDPSGSLTPNTPVMVSYKIQFAASSGETFPSGSELQMSTDLDKPKWTWTLILDGIENPRPQVSGKTLSLIGFELSYPAKVEQAVRVTLEGTTPAVDKVANKTIIRIQEVDQNNNILQSTKVERTAMVISNTALPEAIAAARSDLQTFRSHIDEKAAIGIDTSAAEFKYNDAKSKIDAAAAQPTSGYATALTYLSTVKSLTDDGEKALDKSWAENEVANTQGPIDNVDKVIGWFKGNKTTADLPELSPIISKREIAVSYISTANDEIAKGNYAQARSKATEAFAKGNESYTDALKLQYKIEHPDSPIAWFLSLLGGILKSGVVIIAVAVVTIVLIAVGIIIYRKRSRWDELG